MKKKAYETHIMGYWLNAALNERLSSCKIVPRSPLQTLVAENAGYYRYPGNRFQQKGLQKHLEIFCK